LEGERVKIVFFPLIRRGRQRSLLILKVKIPCSSWRLKERRLPPVIKEEDLGLGSLFG